MQEKHNWKALVQLVELSNLMDDLRSEFFIGRWRARATLLQAKVLNFGNTCTNESCWNASKNFRNVHQNFWIAQRIFDFKMLNKISGMHQIFSKHPRRSTKYPWEYTQCYENFWHIKRIFGVFKNYWNASRILELHWKFLKCM